MADEQVADAPVETGEAPSEVVATWKDDLPEDIRGHQSLETFTDVGALAKSYVHAQSMIGADKVPVPGKWADESDWNEVYDRLGRPKEGDGYELDFSETPEGTGVNDDFVAWFRTAAHGVGLNNNQAQQLSQSYIEFAANMMDGSTVDVEGAKQQAVTELKKEFGNAYDERLGRGNNFVDEFGEEGLTDLVLEGGIPLRDHPAFVKTLINAASWIHDNVSEDKVIGDRDSNAMTPAEAQSEINELQRPDSPYWDRSHPQHDDYVQKVQRLMGEIFPEEESAA
jgi:hypothetical protein